MKNILLNILICFILCFLIRYACLREDLPIKNQAGRVGLCGDFHKSNDKGLISVNRSNTKTTLIQKMNDLFLSSKTRIYSVQMPSTHFFL